MRLSCFNNLMTIDSYIYSEEIVKELPLLTALSGPASTMSGAAFLSGVDDAIVVDVDETTTNVGVIKSGLPCMGNDCFKVSTDTLLLIICL